MKRTVILRYLASVLAVYGAMVLAYRALPLGASIEAGACFAVAWLSEAVGGVLGLGIGRWDTFLISRHYSFVIIDHCTGLDYLGISLCAAWCIRAPVGTKLRLSLFALFLVIVLNQARIQSIFWAATASHSAANIVDYTVWPCLGWMILVAWVFWCLRMHLGGSAEEDASAATRLSGVLPCVGLVAIALLGACEGGPVQGTLDADGGRAAARTAPGEDALAGGPNFERSRGGRRLHGRFKFDDLLDPIWVVLESSAERPEDYDRLYIDRNGNGNLGEPGEEFSGKVCMDGDKLIGREFAIDRLTIRGDAVEHRNFLVGWAEGGVSYSMLWAGKFRIWGGVGTTPAQEFSKFSPTPRDAPLFCLDCSGPLEFQEWMSSELTRGRSVPFKVAVGRRGRGASSFTRVDDAVLADGMFPVAQLNCRRRGGERFEVTVELSGRC